MVRRLLCQIEYEWVGLIYGSIIARLARVSALVPSVIPVDGACKSVHASWTELGFVRYPRPAPDGRFVSSESWLQ